MMAFFQRTRDRKVARWGLAYLAGSWLVLQVLDVLTNAFAWPSVVARAAAMLLAVGLLAALVLAWFHGEKGEQRVSGMEVLMLTGILILAAAAVAAVAPSLPGADPAPHPLHAAGDGAFDVGAASERSIAVLPFANMSGDPDNEYFSDGVTEDILTKLARVPGLRVTSRTSVMRYKETERSIPEIARELRVRHVLEGSVRRVGDRVRITAQLIRADRDEHVWAENYDRDLTDVFALQSEIAEAIAAALEVRIGGETRARLAAGGTTDPRAYDDYLRGRELYYNLREPSDHLSAVELLRRAVSADSTFALGWALLARASDMYSSDSTVVYAEHTISLAPNLPDGYSALGEMLRRRGRFTEARAQYRAALEKDPGHVVSIAELGQIQIENGLGDLAEGVRLIRRAITLEPTTTWHYDVLAAAYTALGELDRAEESGREYLRLAPGNPIAFRTLAWSALHGGNPTLAAARADSALASATRPWPELFGVAAYLHLIAGDTARALRLAERAQEVGRGRAPGGNVGRVTGNAVAAHLLWNRDRAGAAGLLRMIEEASHHRLEQGSQEPSIHLHLAWVHTIRGEHDEAVAALREWTRAGGRQTEISLALDPILSRLGQHRGFHAVLSEQRQLSAQYRQRLAAKGLL